MPKRFTFQHLTRRVVFIIVFFILLLFGLYGYFIQTSFVKSTIQSDTKIMADVVFENLYIAMQRGSNKEELDAIVHTIASTMQETQIDLYDKKNVEALPFMREILLEKNSYVMEDEGIVHFYTPIVFQQKCLQCHIDANIDDIAAVMHFASPLSNIKISLQDLSLMLLALFIITIIVLFSFLFIIFNHYFASPTKNLVRQMNSIASHDHLRQRIKIDAKISEIHQIEVVFNQQNKKLFESYKQLENISNTDKLTGVANRKKFEELVNFYRDLSRRHKEPFSLVLIDLNRFKVINDTHGHHIGDMVLIAFVTIINSFIRSTDTLCRIGGDEFILLLPHTTSEATQRIIEKITEHLETKLYSFENIQLKISASFGVVEFAKDSEEISELLRIADEKMYQDKQNKHRV